MAYFFSDKTHRILIAATVLLVGWLLARVSLSAMNTDSSVLTDSSEAAQLLDMPASDAPLEAISLFAVHSANE